MRATAWDVRATACDVRAIACDVRATACDVRAITCDAMAIAVFRGACIFLRTSTERYLTANIADLVFGINLSLTVSLCSTYAGRTEFDTSNVFLTTGLPFILRFYIKVTNFAICRVLSTAK